MGSFEFYQSLLQESLEYLHPSVDAARRAVLLDAVQQADTVEELGLLTLLPGLRFDDAAPRPQSQMLALLGATRSLIVVVTQLVLAHPQVLARRGVAERDSRLYAVMGGVGVGSEWHPLPHSLGRCRVAAGGLTWLDDQAHNKERQYGLLHRLEWQRTPGVRETLRVAFRTYHGELLDVEGEVTARNLGRWRDWSKGTRTRWCPGLLPYRDCGLDYWSSELRTTLTGEWWRQWRLWHPVVLDQWVKVRLRFRGDEAGWQEIKGLVTGPLQEGDRPTLEREEAGWRLRVVTTVAVVSDTSGRSMFFPSEYELTDRAGTVWRLRSTYAGSVVYFPNGNMNWLGPGTVYDAEQREVGVCILEAHQLQSLDEVIGTTLQLAGFVDRRDDDTRNDWQLFRP